MNINTLTNYALAAMVAGMFLTTTVAAQDIEPTSVHQVFYSGGSFFQIDPHGWREDVKDSQPNIYLEMDRTERSVFLYDVRQQSRFELDLYQHKVFRLDPGGPVFLHDITNTSTRVNARVLKSVRYINSDGSLSGGIFLDPNGQWYEFSDAGWPAPGSYRMRSRGDWTIDLTDYYQQGATVHIDLATRAVTYTNASGETIRRTTVALAQ